ncbi:hypothetical protein [Rhodohalobacter sp. 8-1]|uniref:hypothetical protein n=1 Tax=Rhodohalobacter sp. 8-1 TaxID=3131972 RepID=UPI0030EF132A
MSEKKTIRDIYQLIDKTQMQTRKPHPLTVMEKKALQKAGRDIENGDVMSEEEASSDIENWL